MAEHGTPDQITSQAPFIQALVQKSVTAITNLAGRLSFGMLGKIGQLRKGVGQIDGTKVAFGQKNRPRIYTDSRGYCVVLN